MSSIKLHENLFVGSRVVPCGRTDRQIGRETDRRTDRKIDIQQSLFAILRTPVKLQRFRCLHSLPFFVCLSHLSRNKWTIFKHLCALSLPANLFVLLPVMKLIEIQRWIFCFISLSIIPFIPFYLPSPPTLFPNSDRRCLETTNSFMLMPFRTVKMGTARQWHSLHTYCLMNRFLLKSGKSYL